ncbi:hypothetical protein HDU83_009565 [Entophlyctis luteolus]|nr:hypothetical protein HDU83_009565 [Entophlyctis luteolus]
MGPTISAAAAAAAVVLVAHHASAQFLSGGPTQPGLPAGCLGSCAYTPTRFLRFPPKSDPRQDPNIPECRQTHWHITTADPCYPLDGDPRPGQQVYIKDELHLICLKKNFCINLPDPDSIFLQNNFYNVSKLPSIVQAEGYVRSFCMGSYIPPGAKPMPPYAIRSAHVLKNLSTKGSMYIQIHGTMDCDILRINCTQSSPGAYDDGGQYDNGPYESCGKEPYSGVDKSSSGNPGFQNYVEQAGDGIFCMRVCEPGTMIPGYSA